MKKLLFPLCAMLLCMAACQKENDDVLFLDVEHYTTDAKLHLDDANYAVWDNGDEIWFQTSSNSSGATKQVTIQNNKACITGVSGDGPYTAIYAKSNATTNGWNPGYTNSSYHVTYPSTQYYSKDNNGRQVIEAPMAARCTDGSRLRFYNLGSVLAVNVTNNMGEEMCVRSIRVSAAEENVKLNGTYSFTFPADNGRPTLTLSGESGSNSIILDCSQNTNGGVPIALGETKTFYIALPPVEAQLTIKVNHNCIGSLQERSQASSNQFLASCGYNVPFAIGVPSNEIWYVTTDGQVADIAWAIYSPGPNRESNTYNNGYGVIHFSGDVTFMRERCFENKTTLKKIILPTSVKTINGDAFRGCSSLESVTMPGVEEIGGRAFKGSGLMSVTLPAGVRTIGAQAFDSCASLASVEMPNVQIVGAFAFRNCSALTSVELPSVDSIYKCAFMGCTNLCSVDMGSSIKTLERAAFHDCTSLYTINCRAATPPELVSPHIAGGEVPNGYFGNISTSAKLHVPVGAKSNYTNSGYWISGSPFNENNIEEDL